MKHKRFGLFIYNQRHAQNLGKLSKTVVSPPNSSLKLVKLWLVMIGMCGVQSVC